MRAMTVRDEIDAALQAAFRPMQLVVVDDSASHAGHAGHREEGETHFNVIMRSDILAPLSRIARHRAVHAALGPVLVGRIHALALDLG